MKKKMLFAFALVGLSLASAKTYTVSVSEPAAIGETPLKSGEYRLELKGDRVVLRDGSMLNEFAVRVEDEGRKNANTTVTYSTSAGSNRIEEIRLGGTTLKLVFSN